MNIGFVGLIWQRLKFLRHVKAQHFLVGFAAVFFALSVVVHHPSLLSFDREITLELQQFRNLPLDYLAQFFTYLGNTATLIAVGGLGTLLFYKRGNTHAAILAALSPTIGLLLNMLLKEIIRRPRPDSNIVEVLLPTIGLSFPSGHAMASTTVYGFLAYMAWIHMKFGPTRFAAVLGLAVLPPVISLSRVYVGAHWFSDVFGGITAGLFVLLIFSILYRRWTSTPEDEAVAATVKAV
ncbi:MAG TPA: phosphatase PAP2 family protein [Fimbriimonadaceae bacterium]|nr:phosphatase PAP2 family protein [Fimbriimonadaceae bacterium]